jgi:hypothetical protein
MRWAILAVGLAGCGQAAAVAPVATTPAASVVSTAPIEVATTASAAMAAIPATNNGWNVAFSGCTGQFAGLNGQTIFVPQHAGLAQNVRQGVNHMGDLNQGPRVGILIVFPAPRVDTVQSTDPSLQVASCSVAIPGAAGRFTAAATDGAWSGSGPATHGVGTVSGSVTPVP